MNRTHLFRALSLGLASLTLAGASLAASSDDVALLVQADGLITNDMRAEAEQIAIAALVEADGLVTAQLRQDVETLVVARIAAADGLVVSVAELAPSAEPSRSTAPVLLVAGR
jgi:hypothetical protein